MRFRRRGTEAEAPHPLPDTLCLLPWLNLSIDVDGSSRPCCKFDHAADVDGEPLLGLEQASLAEIWDGPGLVELRAQFLAGERPAGCASCWAEEAAGVPSFRQSYLRDRRIEAVPDPTDLHPAQPSGLDLKLSNTCNLACRICGPVASSRWLTEELAVAAPEPPASGTFVAFLRDKRRYLADNKLTGRPDDRATLESWAADVEHLELTGGEPMLSKESAEMIELLVAHGRPEQTTLQITTNATTMSPRITDHLERFEQVSISLSVDDIGPRFEYQRDPAVWSDVERNIAAYAAMASATIQVSLNVTVSTLNVWDLPDLLSWWAVTYPGYELWAGLNFLHDPDLFCVQQLPEPVKDALEAHWDEHPSRRHPRVAPMLDDVLRFTRAETAVPDRWTEFLLRTRELDARREQRFEAVYPAFAQVLAEHGALDA